MVRLVIGRVCRGRVWFLNDSAPLPSIRAPMGTAPSPRVMVLMVGVLGDRVRVPKR